MDELGTRDRDRASIAELAARVAELERVVEVLSGRRPAMMPRVAAVPSPPLPAAPPGLSTVMPSLPPLPESLLPVPAAAPAKSLEDRLGAQVFNLVGIVALLAGAAWALKLAIEHGYLGPVARVLIGIAAGVGLVLWSENFRRKGLAAFSYSLKAVGTGALYLSIWAGFHLYHLAMLPAWAALSAMVLVTAWNAYMAWAQDAELLAAYALLGGFATPLLLSTGGNQEGFLFTYLAALDLGVVLLLWMKPWRRLVLPVFFATVAYFVGWYAQWFHLGYPAPGWNSQSFETAAFVVVFASIFAALPLGGASASEDDERGDVMVTVLLPLGYGTFEAMALSKIFQDSGLHSALAWLMVGLAAVYLLLMRLQKNPVTAAVHLALAVIFLTAAIPVKASGHPLTIAWLVEGLVLYWISTRFEARQQKSAGVLCGLSLAGYALGLSALVFRAVLDFNTEGFFNASLGSAMVALAMLGGAVWLASQETEDDRVVTEQRPIALLGLLGMALVAVLLVVDRELVSSLYRAEHVAFFNADFATALVGLAALAGGAWWALRLQFKQLAGAMFVGFNLLAILSVEREIGALWNQSDANLQRSLAISGFLMLYGTVLLAIGFWRRSGFTRWQALILLLFTICKVFLYDTLGLSAGYRVVSFMGLGLVLMGVSLAYQKDWLGLKDPKQVPGGAE